MGENSASSLVMYMILAVVGAILIGMVVFEVYEDLNNVTTKNRCYDSVGAHSQLVQASKGDIEPDIYCPTRFDTIDKDKSNNEALEQVSKYWAECWREWHRGQTVMFKDEGVYCHVCHVMDFEDREELEGLYQYLNNYDIGDLNNLAISAEFFKDGKKPTIYEYLLPFSTEEQGYIEDLNINKSLGPEEFNPQLIPPMELTENDYAIVISYAKGQSFISELAAGNRKTGVALGTGIFLVGGSVAIIGAVGSAATAAGAAAALTTIGVSVGWIPGAGWIVGGVLLAAAGGITIYSAMSAGGEPESYAVSSFMEYTRENLDALGCTELPAHQR